MGGGHATELNVKSPDPEGPCGRYSRGKKVRKEPETHVLHFTNKVNP